MKYKDMINEMYGINKPVQKKVIKEEVIIKKYYLSEDIKNSSFYGNISPLDQYNLDRYIDKEIQLFEGTIGFTKTDSLVNGVEVPFKYLRNKK